MAGESPPRCSACDAPLGDPDDEIAHPDDPDAPEDAHFTIQERKDGELRAQCTQTGQLAAVVAGTKKINPINGEVTGTVEGQGEGDTGQPTQDHEPEPTPTGTSDSRDSAQVYDLPEDRDQEDVLMEVVTNESYGLSNEQIKELQSWSKDYDGQMPPDAVQEVLSLMNGINKQTAKLVRERYELRLNRWIREQNSDDKSPSIGAGNQRGVQRRGSRSGPPRPTPTPEANDIDENQSQEPEPDPEPDNSSRMEARQRRRSRAVDKAVDEFADQFAKNLASDAGSFFSDARDIARTLLKKKAEKDPDWFFEKMEQYDMELVDTVLEPSEQRKEEMMSGGGGSSVDMEIDNAVDDMMGGGPPDPPSETETVSPPTNEGMRLEEYTGNNSPMTASPEDPSKTETTNTDPEVHSEGGGLDDETQEEEDQFDEIFG